MKKIHFGACIALAFVSMTVRTGRKPTCPTSKDVVRDFIDELERLRRGILAEISDDVLKEYPLLFKFAKDPVYWLIDESGIRDICRIFADTGGENGSSE